MGERRSYRDKPLVRCPATGKSCMTHTVAQGVAKRARRDKHQAMDIAGGVVHEFECPFAAQHPKGSGAWHIGHSSRPGNAKQVDKRRSGRRQNVGRVPKPRVPTDINLVFPPVPPPA